MYWGFIFFGLVLGDVAVVAPEKARHYNSNEGMVSMEIKWTDDNTSPDIKDAQLYSFGLCTGTNDNIKLIQLLQEDVEVEDIDIDTGGSFDIWTFSTEFNSTITDDGIYFIQIVAKFIDISRQSIHYSERFYLDRMDGKKKSGHGTMDRPPNPETTGVIDSEGDKITHSSTNIDAYFTIPYSQQTGKGRYAPQQPMPSRTWKSERWTHETTAPTSGAYKKPGSAPRVEYTITQPRTYEYPTSDNTMKPLETYLSWYDPRDRIQAPQLRDHHSHS